MDYEMLDLQYGGTVASVGQVTPDQKPSLFPFFSLFLF